MSLLMTSSLRMKDKRRKVFANLPPQGHKGFVAVPVEKRIWGRLQKKNDCWVWKASRNKCGYGIIKHEGKMWLAHRIAFVLATGRFIPPKMNILHRCDNPPCINPGHLFLGTQADNIRDMLKKNRDNPGGYKNGKRKPTIRLVQ